MQKMYPEVLEQAMERLTKATIIMPGAPSYLVHKVDVSRVKELFKALKQHSMFLDAFKIRELAIINGWPEGDEQKLAELAQHIWEGGRVQIPHKTGWGEQVVKDILAQ